MVAHDARRTCGGGQARAIGKPLSAKNKVKASIIYSMNPRYHGTIMIVSGSTGCVGFLSGIACGMLGYQTAGVDLCVIGFVGTVIGGTLAMLHWPKKD